MQEDLHKHYFGGWRFKAMIATIIITAIGYLLFTLWGGWDDVYEAVYQFGMKGTFIAISFSLFCYFFRFIRWQMYLKVLGFHIHWTKSLKIYIAGFSLTATPGKAGEALRSVFLKDYGVEYRKSFGMFISERISDTLAVTIIAAVGLAFFGDLEWAVVVVGIILVLVLYMIQKEGVLHWIESVARKRLPTRFSHAIEFFIETMIAFRSCFKAKVLLLGTLLGVLAWGSEGTALYFLIHILGYDISFLTVQFIHSFSLLVGALTFLPGGLGGVEVTMVNLLIINGIPTSSAVALTLFIRLATLWFSIFLGIIALPKRQLKIR